MEKNNNETEQVVRARIPKGREVIGIVEQRAGGIRMIVKCLDGVSRNCRVPGRLQRELWLRENDVVIVEPWEFDNTKGDIIFKYSNPQIEWLKRKGFLNKIDEI